jgi:hypothetical protein
MPSHAAGFAPAGPVHRAAAGACGPASVGSRYRGRSHRAYGAADVYVISVSGTKSYSQPQHDYTEVGLTKVATYQVLDIQISGNRLVYRAYDIDGKLRDEFVIEK